MSIDLTVDLKEWKKAAKELLETSSRTLEDFTNGQALKVSSVALKETEKADRALMEYQLGLLAYGRTKNKRTGKWNKFRRAKENMIISADSLAERILAKRFKDTGKWGVPGSTMGQRVRNLIAARARSIAFTKSGWIPAIVRLSSMVKRKPKGTGGTSSQARQYGKAKGYVMPARFSWFKSVYAELANQAMKTPSKYGNRTGNPMKVAEVGLKKALNLATQDMREELARRLQPDFDKVSAK